MNRDIVIDKKIKGLKQTKEKLASILNTLEKFITNLKIGSTNLRTISSIYELNKAFRTIYNIKVADDVFAKEIVDPSFGIETVDDIEGYSYENWIHDFKILYKKIAATKKLESVTKAIDQLEAFYSEDKITDIKFNALLDSIDSLA